MDKPLCLEAPDCAQTVSFLDVCNVEITYDPKAGRLRITVTACNERVSWTELPELPVPRNWGQPVEAWRRPLNRWHAETGVFHLTKDDGAPRCGASYYAMSGPYPYEPDNTRKCKRCLGIQARPPKEAK